MINFLTVAEAAKLMRCKPVRVYALLQQGRIVGASKFGQSWMMPVPIMIMQPEHPRSWEKLKFGKDVILVSGKL